MKKVLGTEKGFFFFFLSSWFFLDTSHWDEFSVNDADDVAPWQMFCCFLPFCFVQNKLQFLLRLRLLLLLVADGLVFGDERYRGKARSEPAAHTFQYKSWARNSIGQTSRWGLCLSLLFVSFGTTRSGHMGWMLDEMKVVRLRPYCTTAASRHKEAELGKKGEGDSSKKDWIGRTFFFLNQLRRRRKKKPGDKIRCDPPSEKKERKKKKSKERNISQPS